MLTWIRKLVAAPVFEDKEKTRAAGLLNAILLILLTITMWVIPLFIVVDPASAMFNLPIGAVMAAVSLGLLFLTRRGYVRIAGLLLSSALLVMITATTYIFGGVRSNSATGYFLAITIAGLLLGGRAAVIFGLLSMAAALGVFYAEIRGAIVIPMPASVELVDWFLLSTILGVGSLLLRFAVRSIAEGFEQARQEITERKRAEEELRKHRDHLEELVGERTAELRRINEELAQEIAERARAEELLKELFKMTQQAKEEWESTVDSLPELICLVDDRGRIIRANRTVETWNLGRVVDVEGRGVHELLHPGCAGVPCRLDSCWKQAWEEAMRGQTAQCEAYDEVLKRHVLVRVQPWKGEAVGSTVVTVQDISEHKRAEERLHIFEYIVESSIDAILMTDSELQVVHSNRACNQLMARNVVGQPLVSLWFEEDLPLLNSIIEQVRVGGFFSAARLIGFHSVIAQYPGIEIVGTLAADWNREKGRQAAEEFLMANPPGTLDVIWAASGEMGLGAMLAVEAAGRQDEVKVFTNDVTPESANRMREGRLMAETHHGFAEWGWYGTKFAVMLALGQDVPQIFDIRPRTMYRDNVNLFYPTPALEPIDWEGIKAGQELPEKIVIGWAPADISGVYETATRYFEQAAAGAREHGINVEVITRTPATHVAFADQVAIIEDYIQRPVDVIAISAIEVEVIRPAIKKANEAGIPVIIVNQLEPIEGIEVASYIGFDNTVVGAISAYAVVDYLGGPGVLGEGEEVEVEPGTYLDLAWWQALYKDVDPSTIDVRGRVAIIEGISGNWRGENRLVRMDGGVVYADSITFPVHNKAGQFVGLVASFRDATQRKQAEEALKEYAERLEEMVEERTAELKAINERLRLEITERQQAEEALRESEEKYRTILENIEDGYYEVDLAGNLTFFNDSLCRLYGYSEDELMGMNNRQYMDDETAKIVYQTFNAVYRTGKPAKVFDWEVIRKDGTRRFVEASVSLIRDSTGEPAGFRGIIRDITERKRAEEALRDEKALMDALMDSIPDSIYFKDRQCRLIRISRKMMRDLNLDEMSQTVGKTDVDLFGEEFGRKTLAGDQRIMATGEPIIGLIESRQLEDGQINWTLTTKVPLRDTSGQIVGLVGITREINELMRAEQSLRESEEQLQRYAAELEQANEEVKQFAYIVSHDLRSPLVNLKGFTTELRFALEVIGPAMDTALPHLDEKQRQGVSMALQEDVPEALGFIDSSVTHMDRFIGALLKLSRLGHRELHLEPVDMEALVQATLQTLAHQIEERQVEVTVGPLPKVVADRTSMEQIMGNLLGNAVKYLEPDRPGEIEITAERGPNETTFHIRDNGRGIAAEDMDKVFAPFRRVGRQDVPGEGMGLPYVQALVRRHGGRIWCESELGVGTTFSFTISNHIAEGGNHV